MFLGSSLSWLFLFTAYFGLQPIDRVKFEKYRNEISVCYQTHQAEKSLGYKNGTLTITEQGFLRYTIKSNNGKTSYYSLKLEKLKNIYFLGTENASWLVLNCKDDSIIHQTYQDKNGNIDEMINNIKIPMKDLNIELVNQLNNTFHQLKDLFDVNTVN